MESLAKLSVDAQVGLLFVGLFGVLVLATLAALFRSFRVETAAQRATHERLARSLRAVWIGAMLFWIAWAAGPLVSTLLFGLVSFIALREFVTLTHTRRADHRSLLLAFFVVLPAQYVLAACASSMPSRSSSRSTSSSPFRS
jgi:phosphatidate cytidylyltransferase